MEISNWIKKSRSLEKHVSDFECFLEPPRTLPKLCTVDECLSSRQAWDVELSKHAMANLVEEHAKASGTSEENVLKVLERKWRRNRAVLNIAGREKIKDQAQELTKIIAGMRVSLGRIR